MLVADVIGDCGASSLDGAVTPGARLSHRRSQFLWDVLLPLSLATWNVPGFFGSVQSSHQRVRWKQRTAAQLLTAHQVVALQEVHGNEADLGVLAGRHGTHHFFGTFCESVGAYDNSRAGGVILAIDKRLCSRVGDVCVEVLEEGRVIAACLGEGESSVLIVAVHIDPMKTPQAKRVLVDDIRACCRRHHGAWIFVLGDFNFSYRDDTCVYVGGTCDDASVRTPKADPLSDYFDDRLSNLVELHQPDFTHCRMNEGRVRHLSRIDRVYTSIPSCELLDMWAVASVWGSFDAVPSDHLPVSVKMSRKPSAVSSVVIRPWVAKSADFGEAVRRLWSLRACESAIGALQELKDCMRAAAREVVESERSPVCGLLKSKLYAATLMVRAVRAGDYRAARKAQRLLPRLADFVDINSLAADVEGLYAYTASLNRADAEVDLAALAHGSADEAGAADAASRDVKRAGVLRRSCAWRLRRPRVQLRAIVGEDGCLAATPEEAGRLLVGHWQPVFESREIDRDAACEFLSYAQPLCEGVQFECSREVVAQCIGATKDSCPGPDGVPYAAWRAADGIAAEVVHDALVAVLEGSEELPEQFNVANMVLLPKGEVETGVEWVSKAAADTRPLCLSNTDSKMFALVLNWNLSVVCQRGVSSCQRGFVRGRRIEECILGLESSAACASMVNVRTAAAILFDFRVAFPSLAHDWIYLVLDKIGVPARWIALVRKLYDRCLCRILFAGADCASVEVRSGIKQGCPASGSIFALAADPLIRYMLMEGSLRSARIFAYADDLALVTGNLGVQLPRVLGILARWARASALELNAAKCVVIPLGGASVEGTRAVVAEVAADFVGCSVARSGKYLGVYVGDEADDRQWAAIPRSVAERTGQIRDQHSGLVFSLIMFKVYVTSLLQYKLQFHPPGVALCKLYAKCEQRILACPWNAVPEQVLHGLKCLGMKVELSHLPTLARAAQARLVASLPSFWDLHSEACATLEAPECILAYLGGGWYQNTALFRLAANWRAVHPIRGVAEAVTTGKPKSLQRLVYEALRGGLAAEQVGVKVRARLTKLLGRERSLAIADSLVIELGHKSQPAPLAVRASVVRTTCNAWVTSVRMHGAPEFCRFGCGAECPDSMKHYLNCPHLRAAASRYLSLPRVMDDDSNLMVLLDVRGLTHRRCLNNFLLIDVAFFAFNLIRNSPDIQVRAAVSARVKSLWTRHGSVRAIIDSR
jgi:endonuclease/exonuclease/phosphatase family metal-dependent hydrolase